MKEPRGAREVDLGLFALSCRLDELMADRWLSIRQVSLANVTISSLQQDHEIHHAKLTVM